MSGKIPGRSLPAAPRSGNRTRQGGDNNKSNFWRALWTAVLAVAFFFNATNSWRSTSAITKQVQESFRDAATSSAIAGNGGDEDVPSTADADAEGNPQVSADVRVDATPQIVDRWQKADWFDKKLWEVDPEIGKACKYVENVCFQNQRWFYDKTAHNLAQEQHRLPVIANPHQPHWKVYFNKGANVTTARHSHFIEFQIEKEMPLPPGSGVAVEDAMQQCVYSSVPNHMVLQGYYTHMLGEFFVRVFYTTVMLVARMADVFIADDPGNPTPLSHKQKLAKFMKAFKWQTQLYLNLSFGQDIKVRNLLESHQLFLESLTSNRISPLHALFDNTKCQCAQRVMFCGFEIEEDGAPGIKSIERVGGESLTGKKTGEPMNYSPGRTFLRENFIDNDPSVKVSIEAKRVQYLLWCGFKRENFNTTEGYKIIGLTQRSSRRAWANLKKNLNVCNRDLKKYKICCVEVNVEEYEMYSPVRHLIGHAALDGLIGVHGAQLTEALFMPEGSLVVELLPFVLEGLLQGRWTNGANAPTPVGVMFSETDLIHVGYPLDRSSAWDVECNKTGIEIVQCFTRRSARWDDRSFMAPPNVIRDIIAKFVQEDPKLCSDFVNAAGQEYVVYNANCRTTPSDESSVHHFYRPKGWVDAKVKSGKKYFEDPARPPW